MLKVRDTACKEVALIDKYEVSEETIKKLMKLPTGGTHSVSSTQSKILTYGSMNHII